MSDRREPAAIFLGGALGTLLRAGLLEALGDGAPGWPWATFLVNVAGAFALGYLITALPPAARHRPLWTTGFCGGLTTFSTMQVELLAMLEEGSAALALGYGGAAVLSGLAGVQLAIAIAGGPRPR